MNLVTTQVLGVWAYLLLGLFVMVEGPLATLAAAVAASSGLMKPEWVFFAAATANLSSDLVWYTLGYLGKTSWITRFGGWFGLKQEHVRHLEGEIQLHAPRILLLAKLTMGFVVPTLIATGLARVPLRRWLYVLIIAETIWTGTLVLLGFFFGRYVQTFEYGIEALTLVGSLVFLIVIVIYGIRTIRRLKKKD